MKTNIYIRQSVVEKRGKSNVKNKKGEIIKATHSFVSYLLCDTISFIRKNSES